MWLHLLLPVDFDIKMCQAEMNWRPIGNASKSAVIAFGFLWTKARCSSALYGKKSTLDI